MNEGSSRDTRSDVIPRRSRDSVVISLVVRARCEVALNLTASEAMRPAWDMTSVLLFPAVSSRDTVNGWHLHDLPVVSCVSLIIDGTLLSCCEKLSVVI